MTKETLSEKLFVQKDGKKFAYTEDIKEKIKELKEVLIKDVKTDWYASQDFTDDDDWEVMCGKSRGVNIETKEVVLALCPKCSNHSQNPSAGDESDRVYPSPLQ